MIDVSKTKKHQFNKKKQMQKLNFSADDGESGDGGSETSVSSSAHSNQRKKLVATPPAAHKRSAPAPKRVRNSWTPRRPTLKRSFSFVAKPLHSVVVHRGVVHSVVVHRGVVHSGVVHSVVVTTTLCTKLAMSIPEKRETENLRYRSFSVSNFS